SGRSASRAPRRTRWTAKARSGSPRAGARSFIPPRARVLEGVAVVADLVGPVLAVEGPVLVAGGRHRRPVDPLGSELGLDVEAALEHLLLALGGLEGDQLLIALEHVDQARHVGKAALDELARQLGGQL